MERFYTAQKLYTSKGTPGWKSDQGRVLIMYGPPTEVEKEPTSLNSRAYEVWYYEGLKEQAQAIFIFADMAIFGNYQLIHSTMQGGERAEIYDPDWQQRIIIAR